METDSGDRTMVPILSWECGNRKAEAVIMGSRVITYQYVTVNGCGTVNKPEAKYCNACGRRKGRDAQTGT